MIYFLFEQYGYYPKQFIDNVFYIDGWKFKLDNLFAVKYAK